MTHEPAPNAEAPTPEQDTTLPPATAIPTVPTAAELVWPEPMEPTA